jgi:hypothetical protein
MTIRRNPRIVTTPCTVTILVGLAERRGFGVIRVKKGSRIVSLTERRGQVPTIDGIVYQAIIGECERMEREGCYRGNGHHLAQRLATMVLEKGRLALASDLVKTAVALENAQADRERILDRDLNQILDARAVANWLHARLYEVNRYAKHLAEDGSDVPQREWLSFDFEPEACP